MAAKKSARKGKAKKRAGGSGSQPDPICFDVAPEFQGARDAPDIKVKKIINLRDSEGNWRSIFEVAEDILSWETGGPGDTTERGGFIILNAPWKLRTGAAA